MSLIYKGINLNHKTKFMIMELKVKIQYFCFLALEVVVMEEVI